MNDHAKLILALTATVIVDQTVLMSLFKSYSNLKRRAELIERQRDYLLHLVNERDIQLDEFDKLAMINLQFTLGDQKEEPQ